MMRVMLWALVGWHSLWQGMMHSLRRCTLMTVLRVLSRTGLVHGGVNVRVVHGRIGHIREAILGCRRRRGGMPMRAQIRADATVISG